LDSSLEEEAFLTMLPTLLSDLPEVDRGETAATGSEEGEGILLIETVKLCLAVGEDCEVGEDGGEEGEDWPDGVRGDLSPRGLGGGGGGRGLALEDLDKVSESADLVSPSRSEEADWASSP
jgi:hypothetical protein